MCITGVSGNGCLVGERKRGVPYLAAAELANGSPGPGGELGGVEGVVVRHVRPECSPGGLVVWVHAQAGPDVFGHLGGLFFCKGLGDSGLMS